MAKAKTAKKAAPKKKPAAKSAAKKVAKKKPKPVKAAKKKAKPPRAKPAAKAKPARAKPRTRNTGGRAVGPVPKVRVRMFRQGLGDCFLLTFDVDGTPRHMLIDCGTLGNKKVPVVKFPDVAKHIFETIGTGNLDVVVATHEHQDHLSGFHNADIKKLQGRVDHVWLAWTENPDDKDAQNIVKYKNDLGRSLAAIAGAAPRSEVGKMVNSLLGFAGDVSLPADKFAETVNEAMEFVRTGLGAETKYHEPGDLIEESWLPGFRFYVLGPPRDETILRDLGDHDSDELYGVTAGLRAAALRHQSSLRKSGRKLSAEEQAEIDAELPFDTRFNNLDNSKLARQWYSSYRAPSEKWRTINAEFLNAASNLALQLDSLTNNTSLAFAIERIVDGKVLIFPADAQQGNWLSWHGPKIKWSIKQSSGGTREVTAKDLLSRAVFYKVGHHSSHNATARGKGLELMTREDELTAFIPVDRKIALTRNPKDSWQMPAGPLYRRLLEKCQGRVVRSDLGWAAKPEGQAAKTTEKEFVDLASNAEWKKWGKSQDNATHVTINDLFVEYVLE